MSALPSVLLVFDRKKRASLTVEASVNLSLCYQRKQVWRATGVKLFKNQWDDRLYVVNRIDSPQLNAQLRALMKRVNTWVATLIDSGEEFSFEAFDAWWKGEGSIDMRPKDAFLEFITSTIAKRTDITESTRKQHGVMADALMMFGKIREWEDLTPENIKAWDAWLHNGRKAPTVYNYHKRLKIYINMAYDSGTYKGEDPYRGVKLERGKSAPRVFLLESELKRLHEMDFGAAYLNNVRDLFLFQSLTGMSYIELASFDFERDVEKTDEGDYIMRERRQKTDVDYMVVLVPAAIEILKRHKYVLPVVSNTKYNMYLKALSAAMGLGKNLTTHCARHTFAVTALNRGIPIEVVAKILGHTDIKTTQIYAKIVQSSVIKAFRNLSDLLD